MLDRHKQYAVSMALSVVMLFLLMSALAGCNDRKPHADASSQAPDEDLARSDPRSARAMLEATADRSESNDGVCTPSLGVLNRMVLFQPVFIWAGSEETYQGTGFFAKAPNGKIAAVSSAHFVDFDGPPLLEAAWLEVHTGKPVAKFTLSWGTPGRAGTRYPMVDLRSDYLLMPAPESISADRALELDSRPEPAHNERIWFPNKDDAVTFGHRVVAGTVVQSDDKHSVVVLDEDITLQSQSGSPFISQVTGKVIGTLSSADMENSRPRLLLTPANAILAALARDKDFPKLRSVIGKQRPLLPPTDD